MQTMKDALLYPNQHEKQIGITPRPTFMSGSTNAASQGALMGGIFGGIPGRLLGSAIGTGQDVKNFAGPYGAPGFKAVNAPSHFGNAVSAGMFGQALPQQAIQAAAKVNPNMNPADLYSGYALGGQNQGAGGDHGKPGGFGQGTRRGADRGKSAHY